MKVVKVQSNLQTFMGGCHKVLFWAEAMLHHHQK